MKIEVKLVEFAISHRLVIKAMADGTENLVFIPEDEEFRDFATSISGDSGFVDLDGFELLLEAQSRHPCHWTESGTDSVLMSNGSRHWIRDSFGNETDFPKFAEACKQFCRCMHDDI